MASSIGFLVRLTVLLVLAALFSFGCRDSSSTPMLGVVSPPRAAVTTVQGKLSTAALTAFTRALDDAGSQSSALSASSLALRAYGTDGRLLNGTVSGTDGVFSVALPASLSVRYALVFSDDNFQSRAITLSFPRAGVKGQALVGTETLDETLIPALVGVTADLGALETGARAMVNPTTSSGIGTNSAVFRPANHPLGFFDSDGDGQFDLEDSDDDNDGTADAQEVNLLDRDGDGILTLFDGDWDNDGGANASDADHGGYGVTSATDKDGDGIPDTIDLDDTNDGSIDNSGTVSFNGALLFIGTTDYTTGGTVAVVDIAVSDRGATTRTLSDNVEIIQSDSVLRAGPDAVYAINRFGFNNLQVLEAGANFRTARQFVVSGVAGEASTNTNPYDLVLASASRAFVALYEAQSKHVIVINPLTGAITGSVDLSVFKDSASDRLRPADLQIVGSRCYVLCQNLSTSFTVGAGVLAAFDIDTLAAVDLDAATAGVNGLTLPARNPWEMVHDGERNALYISCNGDYNQGFDGNPATTVDSAVVAVDLATLTATVLFDNGFDAAALDIATRDAATESYQTIEHLALSRNGKLFVSIGLGAPNYVSKVVETSVVSKTLVGTVAEGFAVPDLALDANGFLYVGDRSTGAAGVRVYDTLASNAQRAMVRTDVPPASLAVFPGTGQ